jgi:hypothetical protein
LAAIVIAGYGASVWANLPGHFEPDSLWQLGQGRAGVFNTWHPPVMAWLLGIADRLSPGAPFYIVFTGALFYGGLLAFATLERRPRLITLPVAAVVVVSPLVLIYQGVVWKDVLFADAAMAGFAALAWAGRLWSRASLRLCLLLLACSLFSLAALTRQNGFVVPICGAAVVFAISLARGRPGFPAKVRMARSAGLCFAALALMAITVCAAGYEFTVHGDGAPENLHQLRHLQVYDLAGATHLDPKLDLSVLRRDDPGLERFVRTQAAPNYETAGADNLEKLRGAGRFLIPEGDAAGRQWAELILRHPILYLRTRAGVFLSTVLTPSSEACPVVFTGVDGQEPQLLRDAGLAARNDPKDQWDDRYATAFVGTPVFSHILYGALLLILLVLALRDIARGDHRPELIATVAMSAAALLFAVSFFVISNACDYRYLYFLDVAAMAALVRHVSAGNSPPAPLPKPPTT